MTPEKVKAALLANEGKRVRITYDDGVVESVDVHSVNDEGCLHSGPDGVERALVDPIRFHYRCSAG
jgi:hypothetical protein